MDSEIKLYLIAVIASLGVAFGQTITVVNGASFQPAGPVAPGSFASIFGQNLCWQTETAKLDARGMYPATLGGCSVAVNGIAAMMQFASPGQMNFVVPQNAGAGTASVNIQNGMQPLIGSMMIGPAGPGMFSQNGMGMGNGAMLLGTDWRMGPFSAMTSGNPTPVAIFVTGMDLSIKPVVTIGGIPADVTFYGNAPGYPGLQQINITLLPGMAGAGRVPVTVTSDGQTSNVTFMELLPTTAMMLGMPGWGQGMMIGENMARGHELSYMAFNAANDTALVADENDDVLRIISIASSSTIATITLPSGSQAYAVAVNAAGNLAAVALSAKASVAIIDLSQNKLMFVAGTGYYPGQMAFWGSNLLVANGASGTVSVIDSASGTVTQSINVGHGAAGIAVSGNTAVVTDMQAGAVSMIDLASFHVSSVPLPAGSRPYQVAISAQANKAVITTPMSNGFLILDLGTKAVTQVDTGAWNGMGPCAIAVAGGTVYIANQMTASVTVVDLASASVVKTFAVDPGPMSLAADPAKNQLLVLAEGTGTLDVVDLASDAILTRINAGDTERQGQFIMPLISSITPNSARIGSSFALTITGSGFQGVQKLDFTLTSAGMGPGMMGGGGGMGGGMGQEDPNITISNIQVNADGTQVAAAVQILAGAAVGTREIRLQTIHGQVMGMMSNSAFAVTK